MVRKALGRKSANGSRKAAPHVPRFHAFAFPRRNFLENRIPQISGEAFLRLGTDPSLLKINSFVENHSPWRCVDPQNKQKMQLHSWRRRVAWGRDRFFLFKVKGFAQKIFDVRMGFPPLGNHRCWEGCPQTYELGLHGGTNGVVSGRAPFYQRAAQELWSTFSLLIFDTSSPICPHRDFARGKHPSWGGTHLGSEINLRACLGPSERSFPSLRPGLAIWRGFAPLWEVPLALHGFRRYFPPGIAVCPLGNKPCSLEEWLCPLAHGARREKACSV